MRPASVTPESVARIHDVGFFCLNSAAWDELGAAGVDGLPVANSSEPHLEYNIRDPYSHTAQQPPPLEHPCAPLVKILSSGTFYYALSPQWDISSRLARRVSREKRPVGDTITYDDRFLWNEYIVRSLLDFREKLDAHEMDEMDRCQFIVRSINLL